MKRGWFGPKALGWGASPTTWQGWVVTGVFILAMGATGLVQPGDSIPAWVARAIVLFVFLTVVALTYRRDSRTSI